MTEYKTTERHSFGWTDYRSVVTPELAAVWERDRRRREFWYHVKQVVLLGLAVFCFGLSIALLR